MPQDVIFTDGEGASAGATLIASWGGSGDNCYTTLTKANSFILASVIDPSAWSGATTAQQNASLLEATRDIDARQWVGEPYYATQFLEFPRAVTRNWIFEHTMVSTFTDDIQAKMRDDVEKATAYQGLFLLRHSNELRRLELRGVGIKKISEETGPIKDSVEFASPRAGIIISPDAMKFLSAWMESKRIFRA